MRVFMGAKRAEKRVCCDIFGPNAAGHKLVMPLFWGVFGSSVPRKNKKKKEEKKEEEEEKKKKKEKNKKEKKKKKNARIITRKGRTR